MTKAKKMKSVPAATKTDPAPETWPTRREVGERIGKSERSVRRLEQIGRLIARVDRSGVYRVEPDSLEGHLAAQGAKYKGLQPEHDDPHKRADGQSAAAGSGRENGGAAGKAQATIDGATAAAVFALFGAGKTRREGVVALKLHPDVVQALYVKWVELGGGRVLEEGHIERLRKHDLPVGEGADSLVAAIEDDAADASTYNQLRYPCGCGELIQFDAKTLAAVLAKGALTGWHLSTHADRMKQKLEAERIRVGPKK